MEKIECEVTKKGYPALWEKGGGRTNTGWARVIALPGGREPSPVYVRRRGELACLEHALIIVQPGYWVVETNHHRLDYSTHVYRVVGVDRDAAKIHLRLEYSYSNGEWDNDPPEFLLPAIEAAEAKARCYHCRSPHYVKEGEG